MPAGSGIIVPPNTFTATVEGIIIAGHVPVFVDVDPVSWNLDPGRIEELLSSCSSSGKPVDPHTGAVIRGIMSVDLYGQPADYARLERIASENGLHLLEDACQAHGAARFGRQAGSFGDAAAFSFYPGKNLGAYGEGGAVTTDSDELAARIRSIRDHGSREKYYYETIGHNYRMSAFQGAVLGVKVRYINDWNDARRAAAARYRELLADLPIEVPEELPDTRHVYHLFPLHTPRRDELREFLGERSIASGLHYPYPLHTQKAYGYLGYSEGDFPVSEKNSSQNITLPMFPEITPEQQEEVVEGIGAFLGRS
jgi:dTDP-4-amino-4,6-dideoxygalactose transaminase